MSAGHPARAPAHTSVSEAAEELVAGMKTGRIRARSGDVYKPSAIRSHEAALRDQVVPRLGSTRLVVEHKLREQSDTGLVFGSSAETRSSTPISEVPTRVLESPSSMRSGC